MKNRINLFGVIAFVTIIGLMFIACNDEEKEKDTGFEFTFKNQSNYSIQVDIKPEYKNNWKPNSFVINAGNKRVMVNNVESRNDYYFDFDWKRTDTNDQTGVTVSRNYSPEATFNNK